MAKGDVRTRAAQHHLVGAAPAGQDAFPLLRLCWRGKQQTPADGLLWEFVKQLFCLLQIARKKSLCEPAVDRRKKFAGFVAFASIFPEAR